MHFNLQESFANFNIIIFSKYKIICYKIALCEKKAFEIDKIIVIDLGSSKKSIRDVKFTRLAESINRGL